MTDMAYVATCPDCGGMCWSADDTTDPQERVVLARDMAQEIEIGHHVERMTALRARMQRWCDCPAAVYEVDIREMVAQ